ncbi:Adenine nucleotide alpha hydrolases-like superfamily protein [Raphanus sativus]|uniref:Uncharacterized protein LOC108852509 n=1 Tax=Raphanus sativus TaxID=3726 RepID=A0A6J0NCB4_RAPSA|nr:uncharacterized protein LOC108852509 [Raphanus sativus]KAJ4901118.1 Adenine nucleotide alpha hydrolases-like superfamily protein [Raphanus sativus]
MKNVMVVIDESSSSYDLLVWVLENLQDISNSNKLLIFAKQPQSFVGPISLSSSLGFAQLFYPFSPRAELIRLAQEKNMKIALGILEKAKKISGNHGIKAETLTDVGDPKEPIHKIIQERMINLLVMSDGDQQTSSLKKCLHNTHCSLLVVEKGIRIN